MVAKAHSAGHHGQDKMRRDGFFVKALAECTFMEEAVRLVVAAAEKGVY